jgi:SAM-dependent methyltransferase
MRRLLRPIAHAGRSALGVAGLTPRLDAIDRKLADVIAKIKFASKPADASAADAIAVLDYESLTGGPPVPIVAPTAIKSGSRMCRQGDFSTDGFRYWMSRMSQPPNMNRKLWEWFFIADALFQRGQLEPGRRGIGFGVGLEPLTPLFASHGCHITATDMAEHDASSAGWTGQHAAGLDALNALGICEAGIFQQNVSFRVLDMNDLSAEPGKQFDFCWSSCALEHLGSLRRGMNFVERSLAVLKPGGFAVHTTEFNMSSNTHTLESPTLSLYRRLDLEGLIGRLVAAGHAVAPMDWDRGRGYADSHVDLPPYMTTPLHLRLRIAEYDCTSIGLIVHKAGEA